VFRLFTKRGAQLKRWLLIAVFTVMALGMVIALAPTGPTNDAGPGRTTLAEIGGSIITTQDLQRMLSQQSRRSPYGSNSQAMAQMARPLLDEMVLNYAERDAASKLGIAVSRGEVDRSLEANQVLYPGGKYIGDDQAKAILQEEFGITPVQYLEELRQELLVRKLQRIVTDGVSVTPGAVHAEFLRQNQKARIRYVAFDPAQYVKAVAVTPPALEAFFKRNPERYKLPEQRRVRYVLIDPDHVRAMVQLTDEDLRHYYNDHSSDYRVPERVKVTHILFKTTDKTPAEVATLEKTARDVLAQIKAGKDFGDLAKQYSEDSSAAQGGDIGWIVRGQTVKEFEDAAFSMKPGQVSGLVTTVYGIHILKVVDKQTAHLQAFDEVKDGLRVELEKEKLAAAQQTLADGLYKQMRAEPANFQALAAKAGLEVRETGAFSYKDVVPDFGKSEAFSNLSFQLAKDEVGTPISVPKGTAILKLIEILPEHTPKFEEVRDRVEADYRSAESRTLALQKAQEFAAKAKAGDFQKVAKGLGLTVKESKDFAAQDYVEELGQGSDFAAAFKMRPGEVSAPSQAGANTLVYQLAALTPANEADFAAQRDSIAEQLAAEKRALAFEIYRQNLKQQLMASGDLKVYEPAIQQFLSTYQKP
jgi:peptidyl-prolyl cis-trans isomerase D